MIKYLWKSFIVVVGIATLLLQACSKDKEMIPIPNTVSFEQRLSAYAIFQGTAADLMPSDDFQLLEIRSGLYSYHAIKQRLIKLPEGTKMMASGSGLPSFPDGTILVKTFYY